MSRQNQLPSVTVVICVYNSAHLVGRAIESVLAQNYPKDRLEVIVVDDGSVDDSMNVAARYPVRTIRHFENQGVAAARDTGLTLATGEVYVCFDDDCHVSSDWLRTLTLGYQLPNVNGVGSVICPPKHLRGVVDRYMAASFSGNPIPINLGASRHPIKRFFAYVSDQFDWQFGNGLDKPYAVRQLNGASASFPVAILKGVGGWDRSLRWMEDADLCRRIAQEYPQGHFYAVPTAKMVHDPKMSLSHFLRRPYLRGLDNLRYYRRNHLIPPVFPYPLLWLAGILIGLAHGWAAALVVAAILPQILYVWWPLRARDGGLWHFVFPYLQLGEEMATISGLARGYLLLQMEAYHAEQA